MTKSKQPSQINGYLTINIIAKAIPNVKIIHCYRNHPSIEPFRNWK